MPGQFGGEGAGEEEGVPDSQGGTVEPQHQGGGEGDSDKWGSS